MDTYDRILVPVDGSDGAERASRHALAIAAATEATVEFLHVVDAGGGLGPLGSPPDADVRLEHGRTVLSTAEGLADDAGVDATTELREGRSHEEILAYAAERESDLVAMGRRGAGGASDRLLGGVTDKVLRAGRVPVLVVPRTDRTAPGSAGYRRILLPTDGSDCAMAAARWGAGLAAAFGATVHVVSVVDVQAAGGIFDAGGVSGSFVEELESRGESAVSAMVDRVAETAADPVETTVLRGRPHEALARYAEREAVDLVAMGAHGRSGVQRMVLGSVTDRLLRTVDVPVLVVPMGD